MIPEAAIWCGSPSRARTIKIRKLTGIDSEGRRVYRLSTFDQWRLLKSDYDFKVLNSVLDEDNGLGGDTRADG